jgi:hypothetical protein
MAIIRRPNTNYIAGTGIAVVKADNPGLDAVDVTISQASTTREVTAVWVGPLPTVTGPGLEVTVPLFEGASLTFTLERMFTRLSVLPVGTTTFRMEKSVGGGLFVPVTVASSSHTTSDYEKTVTSFSSSTVTSGDILRLYYVAVAGSGGLYQVQLQGVH